MSLLEFFAALRFISPCLGEVPGTVAMVADLADAGPGGCLADPLPDTPGGSADALKVIGREPAASAILKLNFRVFGSNLFYKIFLMTCCT